MKVTYSGKLEALTPAETSKIEAKFGKIAKLLDARQGEREAKVILNTERHLHSAEITVHYREHDLVGIGSAADTFTAITTALDRLEKQALRLRERLRDNSRAPKVEKAEFQAPAGAAAGEGESVAEMESEEETPAPQVFRINHRSGRKPMTLEEAMLAIGGREYLVYHDAATDRLNVLLRRRDGNFDLIEA
jgi:putative sigma-54 modulation protein